MKGNNGTGNNSDRDVWETPKELWDQLHKQYNFAFDCCANENNKKTYFYSSNFISEPSNLTNCVVWMNPPFSRAFDMFEHFFKIIKKGVAIYRCDNMETSVWQNIILPKCSWVAIPKGRIKYEGFEGNSSRFPSALIGYNVDPPKLDGFIVLYTRKEKLL